MWLWVSQVISLFLTFSSYKMGGYTSLPHKGPELHSLAMCQEGMGWHMSPQISAPMAGRGAAAWPDPTPGSGGSGSGGGCTELYHPSMWWQHGVVPLHYSNYASPMDILTHKGVVRCSDTMVTGNLDKILAFA